MRLKEDRTSWRSSSILHRDNRHDHSDDGIISGKKRSTRKWCKGKVGNKHDYQSYEKSFINGLYTIKIHKCTKCGKEKYGKISKDLQD